VASSLAQILETTRRELPGVIARRDALERAAERSPMPPGFRSALESGRLGLIAEVKRRSPSAGVIRADLHPSERARAYSGAGASVISVLTDGPFFGGSINDLVAVARDVPVPVLRKDFILDEAQIAEARAAGAAAVLLIVRALEAARLRELLAYARALGLEALVEVHTRPELETALAADAAVIGVNSRDLDTFRIDIAAAWELVGRVPADRIAIAESGMHTIADVERAAEAGADGVLIGTALSAAADPGALARAFVEVPRRGR
jgi:indole-3-glycerol phosphate synthase